MPQAEAHKWTTEEDHAKKETGKVPFSDCPILISAFRSPILPKCFQHSPSNSRLKCCYFSLSRHLISLCSRYSAVNRFNFNFFLSISIFCPQFQLCASFGINWHALCKSVVENMFVMPIVSFLTAVIQESKINKWPWQLKRPILKCNKKQTK